MPTTTPSSKAQSGSNAWGILPWLLLPVLAAHLLGCVQMPVARSFFEQTSEDARLRAMQTRTFETRDEKELLSASASVLQDLGFQLEESSKEIGWLRASKERGAREYGQEISRAIVLVLSAFGRKVVLIPVDLHQQINATLVTRRSPTDSSSFSVRILFHRTIWKGDGNDGNNRIPPGEQNLEMIFDSAIYQQFFAKLAKSVFLEAHGI